MKKWVTKRKLFVTGLCAAFLFLGFAFRGHVASFGVKVLCTNSLPGIWKWDVSIEGVKLKKGGIDFSTITISCPTRGSDAGFDLLIEKIEVGYNLDWFHGGANPRISFIHPLLFLKEPAASTKKTSRKFPKKILSFLSKCHVQSGEIHFIGRDISELPAPCYFSFYGRENKTASGTLYLSIHEDEKTPELTLDLGLRKEEIGIDLKLEDFNAKWISDVACFISQKPAEIGLWKGSLRGSLFLDLNLPLEIASGGGGFTLNHFQFKDPKRGISFQTTKLETHLFFEEDEDHAHWWEALVVGGELEKSSLEIEDRTSGEIWDARDLLGRFHFNFCQDPIIELSGELRHMGSAFPFCLSAKSLQSANDSLDIGVGISILDKYENLTELRSKCSYGKGGWEISVDAKDLDHYKCTLLTKVFSSHFEGFDLLSMQEGSIDLTMNAAFKGGDCTYLQIPKLVGKEMHLQFQGDEGDLFAKQIEATLCLGEGMGPFLDRSSWSLILSDARVSHLFSQIDLDHLEGQICMQEGVFQRSYLTGNRGDITLGGQIRGDFVGFETEIQVSSSLNHLSSMIDDLPPLADLPAALGVVVKWGDDSIDVSGNFGLTSEKQKRNELQFGFSLPLSILQEEFSKEILLRAYSSGWFKARDVDSTLYDPIREHFLPTWDIQGVLSLEGRFEQNYLDIGIHTTDLFFDSNFSRIYVGEKKGEDRENSSIEDAQFVFDFSSNTWKGKLTAKNVDFLEKTKGLSFRKMDGQVELNQEKLIAKQLHGCIGNLALGGEIHFSYPKNALNVLGVSVSHIEGDYSEVQGVLDHFNIFSTHAFPLDAKVFSRKKGFNLTYSFDEKGDDLFWDIQLGFREGTYHFSPWVLAKDVSFDFSYKSTEDLLEIRRLSGDLMLRFKEEKMYSLAGHHFILKTSDDPSLSFDVRLSSQTHDVMRLAATSALSEENGLALHFEKDLSHIFGAKFDFSHCLLNSSFGVEKLQASTSITSHEMLSQLQFLFDSGFLPIKKQTFKDFRTLDLEGSVDLELTFDREKSSMQLSALGQDVIYEDQAISPVQVEVMKLGEKWDVSANALSMQANIALTQGAHIWKVDKLLFKGSEQQIELKDGVYSPGTHVFTAQIPTFNLCPSAFTTLLSSSKFLENLTGCIEGKGSINFEMEGLKNWKASAEISLQSEDFGKGHYKLDAAEPFLVEFSSAKGAEIKHMHLNVDFMRPKEEKTTIEVKQLSYDWNKGEWSGDHILFGLDPEFIKHFTMYHVHSDSENMQSALKYLMKWDNFTEFTLSFALAPELQKVNGKLKSGYYWIGNQSWLLDDLQFDYSDQQLKIGCKTKFEDIPFSVDSHLELDKECFARVQIRDVNEFSSPGISLEGVWQSEKGFSIRKIDGKLWGLDLTFLPQPRVTHPGIFMLTGGVKIDATRLSKVLPKGAQEFIKELDIGAGYEVHGDAIIMRDNLSHSYFKGFLKGKDFDLIEYKLNTMLAELSFDRRGLHLKDLNISDDAGIMKINEIKCTKEMDERWLLSIPEILLHDFRPSLLKRGKFRERMKPFIIRDLVFSDIQGYLGEKETFKGSGQLSFINTFKQDINFFDIPLEIISRLGLDMGLLIPVKGELLYEIRYGKIHLTELKNSVSEGKRSHFFLSKQRPSFIEFDGSMHIDVKMKQYVLLKFTEPFTLSIRGGLKNPKYSLR